MVAASLTLWNCRLIDGLGGPAREHTAVSIHDGWITDVTEAVGSAPPGDVVDVEGRSVVPGLIDAHVHLSSDVERSPGFGPDAQLFGEDPRPRELGWFIMAKSAQELLRAGITTVRDVGSYDDEAIVLRRAIELGLVDGPRVLSCGRIVTATAPGARIFGSMYREADGPWEMRKAVREQIRRGADFVKVMSTGARSVLLEDPEPAQMTGEELAAVTDEAHRMGLRVAAHAEGLEGARLAIEHGVDTIEHGLSLHREPELLATMAEHGTVLVPTLSTFHDLAERFTDAFAPALVDQAKRQRDEAYRTLESARAAGVTLAMGFDSGPPGANALELVRMADGGLAPLEAISAATWGSARALGLDDVGTLEPGKVADLLVIDGDPIVDVRILCDLEKLWLVVQSGKSIASRRKPMAGSGSGYQP